jgi:hypothetical protein
MKTRRFPISLLQEMLTLKKGFINFAILTVKDVDACKIKKGHETFYYFHCGSLRR